MAVYGYTRVSTEQQAESGLGLEAQRAQIDAYCERMGLELGKMFEDAGVSAEKDLTARPQGGALAAALEHGDAVVVTSHDRLWRSMFDLVETWRDWRELNVELHMVHFGGEVIQGDGLMASAFKMMVQMLGSFAEYERELASHRTKAVKAREKDRGRFLGGRRPPFGFATDASGTLTRNLAEQEAIVMIDMYRVGQALSYRKIATKLKDKLGVDISYVTCRELHLKHHASSITEGESGWVGDRVEQVPGERVKVLA